LIHFFEPQKFKIDRVKENTNVNQFWVEVFECYFIKYSMGKNEFSTFSLAEQQKELIEKAFKLNIKELPLNKMEKEFENQTEKEKNVLFVEYMKAAVLKIFDSTSMEQKIRTEYIKIAVELNEENMMKF
jgi:hypothetical protein